MLLATIAAARANDPAGAIRAALARWTADFNAGATDRVCGLFARDLRYNFRGLPEQGYRQLCDRLRRSLTDPSRRFHYALNLKEILVSGDIAAVRVVWHLTVSRPNQPETKTTERGLDIFQRQPDGSWKIVRFLAYEE